MFNKKKSPQSKTPKSRLQTNVPHLTPDPNFLLSGVSPPLRFASPGFEYQLQLPQPPQYITCFYQNRPFLPLYNQNAFYQSPTGLYRLTMDSSTSSQANQRYSPLNRSTYGLAHGSAPVDDDDSPVEEMSPVKKPSKRASRAKKNDATDKEPAKDWTKAEEIALCQAWCDVSENSEKRNSMKVKGFCEAVINYFKKETGSTIGGSNDLDLYHKACAQYKMIYMHDFTLGNCYNILKDHQGWLEIEMPNFYKNTKGRKKSKTSEITSGLASGGFNLNDEAEEYEEAREHRPLEGELVYAGPAGNEPLTYFAKFGYICQDHVNPAEFLADLISIDYSSSDSVDSSRKRIDSLVESFSQQISSTFYATTIPKSVVFKDKTNFRRKSTAKGIGGWWRQFSLLLKRAWMQASRDGPTNIVRTRMSIASALIFGSVFWRMGKSQTSIQDRMGLLQVAAINTAMAALTKTVGVFPKERAIVDRERAKGSYLLGPYLLSKLIAEAPIGAAFPLLFGTILYPMARLHPTLSRFGKFSGIVTAESFAASAMGLTVGAMAPTTEAALALGPSLMTVFIVFGGYYVNADNTPIIFRWIPRVSLIRWAFQGLCINEFKGLEFDHQHSFDVQSGEQALERLSFGGSTISETMMAQSRILTFWYFMTYLLLEKNKPKYQPLEPPPVNQPEPQSEPDQTEPQSEADQPDEPVESDDSQGQSFEILETPTADQGSV
nr:ABC transporter G family member 7 isoform X2 [Tanacetum cinerariifolium]